MIDFIKLNLQFILITISWVFVGIYSPSLSLGYIPAIVLLYYVKGLKKELIFGFFFILILSDSRLESMAFAINVKNIYIALLSLFFILDYRNIKFKIPFITYIIPFLIIAFLCALSSPTLGLSIQKTISYGLIFLVIPNYISLLIDEYGEDLFKHLVWFVVILLLYGLVINFIWPSITNLSDRYRGILGNPNGLGIFLILFTILFYVVNSFYENLFTKNEKIFIYILFFLNLYMCGSRSSLIAVLLFLLLAKFYRMNSFLGFLIFVIVLFLYQIISDNINAILLATGLEKYFRLDTLESGSGRLVAWKFAWKHIQKNYFFGLGFNYSEYLFRINYNYLAKLNHQGAVHNSYLTFWLDTGLAGLSLFLGGFLLLFNKIKKITPMVLPILYAVLFSNQFESWLTASLNPFTIQLLIILSLIYYKGFNAKEDKLNNTTDNINENTVSIH